MCLNKRYRFMRRGRLCQGGDPLMYAIHAETLGARSIFMSDGKG